MPSCTTVSLSRLPDLMFRVGLRQTEPCVFFHSRRQSSKKGLHFGNSYAIIRFVPGKPPGRKAEYGVLAQLGERKVRNLEVRGSIPLYSTKPRNSSKAWIPLFLFIIFCVKQVFASLFPGCFPGFNWFAAEAVTASAVMIAFTQKKSVPFWREISIDNDCKDHIK